MFQQAVRIHRSDEDRRTRAEEADVDRAMEVLGVMVSAEEACIPGGVRDLRRRLDALLDDLLPPASRPGLGERLLRRAGLAARARAADMAMATLLGGRPPETRLIAVCFGGGVRAPGERVSPKQTLRGRIADALDDAYCVMLPHEATRRAELHRAFWASARKEGQQREFIARCLGTTR
jgi:hypothetical protein